MYAMMAAGGDLGASVGPQLVGTLTDFAMENQVLLDMADSLRMTAEQFGLRMGILVGAIFPLLAIPLYLCIRKATDKRICKNETTVG